MFTPVTSAPTHIRMHLLEDALVVTTGVYMAIARAGQLHDVRTIEVQGEPSPDGQPGAPIVPDEILGLYGRWPSAARAMVNLGWVNGAGPNAPPGIFSPVPRNAMVTWDAAQGRWIMGGADVFLAKSGELTTRAEFGRPVGITPVPLAEKSATYFVGQKPGVTFVVGELLTGEPFVCRCVQGNWEHLPPIQRGFHATHMGTTGSGAVVAIVEQPGPFAPELVLLRDARGFQPVPLPLPGPLDSASSGRCLEIEIDHAGELWLSAKCKLAGPNRSLLYHARI